MQSSEHLEAVHAVRIISAQGAEFRGIQESPRGRLVIFTDAVTRTTLALRESELSAESVSQRLKESRESYAS